MKNSRKLLVSSLIMIISFCLLFAGTTFAWFSDSITSSNNIITAGNLDVELEYSTNGGESWDKVTEAPIFTSNTWEPGHAEAVLLKVVNKGSLALKYSLSLITLLYDLIKAKTDKTFDVALNQLEGAFSAKIRDIRADLVDVLVNLTVNIDYPDEDIEDLSSENFLKMLNNAKVEIENMLKTYDAGRILREGIETVIVGKPNVGKSTLMNLLSKSDVFAENKLFATLDTTVRKVIIENLPFLLTDTLTTPVGWSTVAM